MPPAMHVTFADPDSDATSLQNADRKSPPPRSAPFGPLRRNTSEWPLFSWPSIKYVGWTILTKPIVAIIYEDIVSQGLISLFPEMGKRLWKVPMFAFLNGFEATHRITLAHVFVLIPLIATWILWSLLLSMRLAPGRFAETFHRFDLEQIKRVILIIGVIVIVADAGLFAASFSMSSWGGSQISPTVILATALYCAVIAFVSFISLLLYDEVTIHKNQE